MYLEEKALFYLLVSVHQAQSGQELKQFPEAMEYHCLLACSVCIIQDHLPRSGITYNGLCPSMPTINQHKAPQFCLQTNHIGKIKFSQLKVPSPIYV